MFLGLLENASITIEKLNADLWVTAVRNSANVDFGNPFSQTYVQRVRLDPRAAREQFRSSGMRSASHHPPVPKNR